MQPRNIYRSAVKEVRRMADPGRRDSPRRKGFTRRKHSAPMTIGGRSAREFGTGTFSGSAPRASQRPFSIHSFAKSSSAFRGWALKSRRASSR